ncbi:hypothetical protein PVAND_015060 [Polypedilum vanderplanki]|uniref:Fatty acid desaturase domain-containing protein n=1 Tax=Polypedilum vanderplanki TaxID=319348 RepID=A0A9J6BB51_POLVA|nr:hypothetical protein PVAND_015060 [Polypedilum vanderplanki]
MSSFSSNDTLGLTKNVNSLFHIKPFKTEIVWRNVIIFTIIHYLALNAFTMWDFRVFAFHYIYGWVGAFGISAGAHRLWCHRSYKANKKLELLLLYLNTIAVQNSVIEWVRDHRVHHKHSDTDADPHNSKRGFFFSHMGWLLCKKHPDVKKFGSKIDMSDLMNNPLLRFQHKYYIPLILLISQIIPIACTIYLFNTTVYTSFCFSMNRYFMSLHRTWFTNSFAHIGTWKPYDKNIASSDSKFFGTICFGEGWHNFHHVFPWDYKVSELPLYRYNFTIAFIDFFVWLGWATDLKVASDDMIRKRVLRTGDGSHPYSIEAAKNKIEFDIAQNVSSLCWGLGDNDMTEDEMNGIKTLHPKSQ